MKQNYETCLMGHVCILVPYRPCHVLKYHEWMQNPELLEATGSEPLSLSEEYEMQQSWYLDGQKCTFIVLDKSQCIIPHNSSYHNHDDDAPSATDLPRKHATGNTLSDGNNSVTVTNDFIQNNIGAMVGDVNLFISQGEVSTENEEDENATGTSSKEADNDVFLQGEVDIMVAEERARGKGIGKEAVCLMIQYGTKILGIQRFFVKINANNTISRKLFEKSLQFAPCGYMECFEQYEYELWRRPKQPQKALSSNHHALDDSVCRDVIDQYLQHGSLQSFTCKAKADKVP